MAGIIPPINHCGHFWRFAGQIARALEDVPGEMIIEVLPSLHLLILEDPDTNRLEGSTEQFVYLRQLCGRRTPISGTRNEGV
jgi:hypothetical protein